MTYVVINLKCYLCEWFIKCRVMNIVKKIFKWLGIIILALILIIVILCIYVSKKTAVTITKGDAVDYVTALTQVGDAAVEIYGFDIIVNDTSVLEGITASDFDILNNTVTNWIDPATGKSPEVFEDDEISIRVSGDTLMLRTRPFSILGKTFFVAMHEPWEVSCTNSRLNFTAFDINETKTAIIDDCVYGQHTYAGITREYLLHLPKDSAGNVMKNVPIMVWNIGGSEYEMPIKQAVLTDRSVVSMETAGVKCATLKFGIANPNYMFSASLDPEKIKLIDRNNAVQMSLIDSLITEGIIDSTRVYVCGASSGGGATMRFCMQFPDKIAAAIPCCSMDPIVPIHQVKEKYEGQFIEDLKTAFQKDVYKWNGSDMELMPIDQEAFIKLPICFAHAEADNVCKVTSSISMFEARKALGAESDRLVIYSPQEMEEYGEGGMIYSHFSWVRVLNDWTDDSPITWMLEKGK